MRLRSGDKHHLRKSADQNAHISPVSGSNAFLICAFFRSADFLRWCLSLKRNLTHMQSLLLFPIVFGINLIHFFDEKKDDAAGNLIVCFSVSIPCHSIDRSKTKNANCFEDCNVFGNGKCELSAIQEGRNYIKLKMQFFWQGKVQTSSPILRCKILARKSAKLIANFSATTVSDVTSVCLCFSLSLTERTSRTIQEALPIIAEVVHGDDLLSRPHLAVVAVLLIGKPNRPLATF